MAPAQKIYCPYALALAPFASQLQISKAAHRNLRMEKNCSSEKTMKKSFFSNKCANLRSEQLVAKCHNSDSINKAYLMFCSFCGIIKIDVLLKRVSFFNPPCLSLHVTYNSFAFRPRIHKVFITNFCNVYISYTNFLHQISR